MGKARSRVKIYLAGRRVWRKFYSRLKKKLKPAELSEERTSPRIVEYPFVLKNLGLKRGKILDVGCSESYLSTELAALGYEVYGIDIRYYPVQYPNVKFVQGDIRKTTLPNDFFDTVVAVSTIEHIGIREPYGDFEDPEGDKKAIKEMTRILKPNGMILITLPYGKRKAKPWYRVYNDASLRELVSGLEIEAIEYFAFRERHWRSVSKAEADETETAEFHSGVAANAVVCLRLSRERHALRNV